MATVTKKSRTSAASKKKAAAPSRKGAAEASAKPDRRSATPTANPTPRQARPAPPADGAVTLAQAKAIVAARVPMRAAAPAGKGAGPATAEPSLGDVARERRQLKLAQQREQKQRIQDYKP